LSHEATANTPVTTIGGGLIAAARTWRSNFGVVSIGLSLVPLIWVTPLLVIETFIPSDTLTARGILLSLSSVAWSSVLWGGQLLLSLEACREGTASIQRLRDGIAFTGQLLWLGLLMTSASLSFGLTPELSGDESRRQIALGLAAIFVHVTVVVVLFIRFALAPLIVVDERVSARAALRRSWVLSKRHSWRIARLGISVVCSMFLVLVATRLRTVLATVIGSLTLIPLFTLAYTHLYLGIKASHGGPARLTSSNYTFDPMKQEGYEQSTGTNHQIHEQH